MRGQSSHTPPPPPSELAPSARFLTDVVGADVENAYAGLEKKGKGKKGKVAAKAAEGPSQPDDKKLMHSLDMLGAFATLKVCSPPHTCIAADHQVQFYL